MDASERNPSSSKVIAHGEEGDKNKLFTTVIPLPDKIEVKTGEEDEELLYLHRAKLFRFIVDEWKERGLGNVEILRHKENKKLRVVMRREKILKICLNHVLNQDVDYKRRDDKSWLFVVNDSSEGEVELVKFSLRFKNKEVTEEFMTAVKKALDGTAEVIEAPANTSISTPTNAQSPSTALGISEEDKKKADKLKLPQEIFTTKTACTGCRGCVPDKFVFAQVKNIVPFINKEDTQNQLEVMELPALTTNKTATTNRTLLKQSHLSKTSVKADTTKMNDSIFSEFGGANSTAFAPAKAALNSTTKPAEEAKTFGTSGSGDFLFGSAASPATINVGGESIFGGVAKENSINFTTASTDKTATKSIYGGGSTAATSANEITTKSIFGSSGNTTQSGGNGTGNSVFGSSTNTSGFERFGSNNTQKDGSIFGTSSNAALPTFGSLAKDINVTPPTRAVDFSSLAAKSNANNPSQSGVDLSKTLTASIDFASLAKAGSNTFTQKICEKPGPGGFIGLTHQPLAARFKTVELAEAFGKQLNDCIKNTQQGGSIFGTSSNAALPTFGSLAKDFAIDFASLAKDGSNTFTQKNSEKPGPGGFIGLTHQNDFANFSKPETELDTSGRNVNESQKSVGGGEGGSDYPIIELSSDNVVSTGEEEETKLFGERAVLYRWDATNKEWKERGVGELKLLLHPAKQTYRLVMRREQIHKLVLNHVVHADFHYNNINNNPESFVWITHNYAESNEGKLEKLAVRFKTVELAEAFGKQLNDCIKNTQQGGSIFGTSSNAALLTFGSLAKDFAIDFASLAKDGSNTFTQKNSEKPGPGGFIGLTHQNDFANFSKPETELDTSGRNVNESQKSVGGGEGGSDYPIIELSSDNVVSTGEEEETKLFGERAVLYRWDATNKEWKERGVGELKLLLHPAKQTYRLVMRREQIHKLVLNHVVHADFHYNNINNNPESFVWITHNYAESNEGKLEKLAVRFKTVELAEAFGKQLNDCIKNTQQGGSIFGTSSNAALPTFGSLAKDFAIDFASLAKDGSNTFTQKNSEKPGPGGFIGLTHQNDFANFSKPETELDTSGRNVNESQKSVGGGEGGSDYPIIELSSDNVVSTGEEEETKLFGERAVLYRWDATNKEWKERGVGELKLLLHPAKQTYRLVMRREQIHKLVLNHVVHADFHYNNINNNPESFVWITHNYAESNEGKLEKLAVRFKTVELAEAFGKQLNDCIKNTQQGGSIFGTSSNAALPTFGSLAKDFAIDFASLAKDGSNTFTQKNSEKPGPGGFIGLTHQNDFANFSKPQTELDTSGRNVNESQKSVGGGEGGSDYPTIELSSEDVVSTGEEEETKLFGERAVLYRWDATNKEWKERGVGELKLLLHPAKQSYRLVMRREQIHKLVLNHVVHADFHYSNMNNNPKSFVWVTLNYAESNEGELEKLAVRFKTVELAEAFEKQLNDCIKNKQQGGLIFGTSSNAALPTFGSLAKDFAIDFGCLAKAGSNIFTQKISEKPGPGGLIGLTHQNAFANFSNPQTELDTSGRNVNESQKSVIRGEGGSDNNEEYYDAILELPSEDVVSTGEEEETKLFGERAVLYRWDATNKEWKERGVGELKLLLHPAKQSYRLVMRREQIHKLVLNHVVHADFHYNYMNNNPKSFVWVTLNYAESNEGELEKLAVRFKTVELAEAFEKQLNDCIKNKQQGGLIFGTSSNATLPTFGSLAKDFAIDFGCLAKAGSNIFTQKICEKPGPGGLIGLTHQNAFANFSNPQTELDTSGRNVNESQKSVSGGEGGSDNNEEYYDAILELPSEDVVSTGEEEETKLFGERAVLYRWDATNKEWKERGVGELKVLLHPAKRTYRLVMRREQIHKLVLNHVVHADFHYNYMNNNPKCFVWATFNYAESNEGELEKLAVRFKSVELAEDFSKQLNDCIKNSQQCSIFGTSSNADLPAFGSLAKDTNFTPATGAVYFSSLAAKSNANNSSQSGVDLSKISIDFASLPLLYNFISLVLLIVFTYYYYIS